jgi:hypothetical protein
VRRAVGSVDDAKDVAFLHDEQLLVADLDLGSRPLPEENMVAGFDGGVSLPFSSRPPGPTAITLPS